MRKPKPICSLDDIPDGDSAAIETKIERKRAFLIAVRRGNDVRLYINSCPHIGSPLDFEPGNFLTPARDKIICSTHGALFEIDSGLCVHGPCEGKSLEPVPSRVSDGKVWLA